jgi:2',3'-cyclic-nucleotide 2'-phosphodiesterase
MPGDGSGPTPADGQELPRGSRVRVLLLGDVCGEPGRKAVEQSLPALRSRLDIDFVIVNCENAAAGYGITPKLADGLLRAGVDCLTAGDHAYDRKEAWSYLGIERRILRPLNLPPDAPGRGCGVYEVRAANREPASESGTENRETIRIAVVSLLGRVFMKPADCPFRRSLPVINDLKRETPIIIVDFHAEATAEKQALGWYLAGHASALLGTHTHVQTADARVLPGGTAYISDVGMCGSFDSVLGMSRELSVRRMIDLVPVRLQPAQDDVRLNGVVVEVDRFSGRSLTIQTLAEPVAPNQVAIVQV